MSKTFLHVISMRLLRMSGCRRKSPNMVATTKLRAAWSGRARETGEISSGMPFARASTK
jgi:hypothetical protein